MNELEMTGLLLKLADIGITGIKVHYAGSGDSGAIESLVYTTEELDMDEVDAFIELDTLSIWSHQENNLSVLNSELNDLVENFVSEKLLNDIEDWYNNDGGEGEVLILVPSGKYQINNRIYITHTEGFQHAGSLLDKTLEQ
jgi:hypothetical protein